MLEQLRQARIDLGLDLNALEQRTRVRVHLLSAVEDGRFDELPRGVYARAVVRAYASAVGIDPHRAVTAVAAFLPALEDPLDGIARVRGFDRHREAAAAPEHEPGAQIPGEPHVAPDSAVAGDSIVTAAPAVPRRTPHVARDPRAARGTSHVARQTAALIDGLVLAGFGLVLLLLTARTAGVPIAALLDFAAPALLMLFGLVVGLYFLLLGGVMGSTVGIHVMHLAGGGVMAPGRVQGVSRRAWQVAVRELSILVDVLLPIVEARAPGGRPGAPRSETPWEDRAPAR